MEEPSNNNYVYQPKPLAELMPNLKGLVSKDEIKALASTKKSQPRKTQVRTVEKVPMRPMTLAEMKVSTTALNRNSPKRMTQAPSVKKRGWNTSVKVEQKMISHTANGQLKNNSVKKVLYFQPGAMANKPSRQTISEKIQKTETPMFVKPKGVLDKTTVRISGIGAIPQTPIESKPPMKTRKTITNKENNSHRANMDTVIKKNTVTPVLRKNMSTPVLKKSVSKMPALNATLETDSDLSFLQKEKEANDMETILNAVTEEKTLENIAEVSPPISTPFKEYRSVQEYFNNSNSFDNSALYNDNTVMCFDRPSICVENDKQEESVIMSLCDLFNKATVVTNNGKESIAEKELDKLLQEEKHVENNIKKLEYAIELVTNIKKSQVRSLQNIKMLIEEKRKAINKSETESDNSVVEQNIKIVIEERINVIKKIESDSEERKNAESDNDKTLVAACVASPACEVLATLSPEKSPILSRPCSVIKSLDKLKKTSHLRKLAICKSMPNVNDLKTPVKDLEGKPLNMYMEMKEKLNFLSTPSVHASKTQIVPDTPFITSRNLKKQLDKLYGS